MLEVELRLGLRRRLAHAAYGALLVAGGWIWLGNGGAGLMALLAAVFWPRWRVRRVRLPLAEVSAIWLWARTTVVATYDRRIVWIFADELSVTAHARLRRRLRSQLRGLL